MNTELITYIQQAQEQGETKENIVKTLLENNWESKDIEEAFHAIDVLIDKQKEADNKVFIEKPQTVKKKSVLIPIFVGVGVLFVLGVVVYAIPKMKTIFVHNNNPVAFTTKNTSEFASNEQTQKVITDATTSVSSNVVIESTAQKPVETIVQPTTSTSSGTSIVKKETIKPVVASNEATTTALFKRITVTNPDTSWKKVEIPLFFANVSMPDNNIKVNDPNVWGPPFVSISDGMTVYSFEEQFDTYNNILKQLSKDMLMPENLKSIIPQSAVVFKGKDSHDIVSLCVVDQPGSSPKCFGLISKYDGRSLLVRCSSEDVKGCLADNIFHSVLHSLQFNPPPYVGVAGFDVPAVIASGGDITIPSGVKQGFLILDLANIRRLAYSEGDKVPVNCISGVCTGSPAEKAGLKSGDIITKVNGLDLLDFNKSFEPFHPGDSVAVNYTRDGKDNIVVLNLTEWPY